MRINAKCFPYKGVAINGGWTKYSVASKKKQDDGTWKTTGWINVMLKGGETIEEKNPGKSYLIVSAINGIDVDSYNGKPVVTAWVEGTVEHTAGGTDYNGFSKLDDGDCPF